MATRCDIGAQALVSFPASGGVHMHIIQGNQVLLAFASTSLPGLWAEMDKKYKDACLSSLGVSRLRNISSVRKDIGNIARLLRIGLNELETRWISLEVVEI